MVIIMSEKKVTKEELHEEGSSGRRFYGMRRRHKISIVGGFGFTGSTTAHWLAAMELGDIVMLDIERLADPTKGKALDLLEATPVIGTDVMVTGTCDYADTRDSDVVIITAGVARKPGMSRDDLLNINAGIIKEVTGQIVRHSPDAIIIVLTNPADPMTYLAYKTSGFPRERVIGQSGILDTARYRTFLAQAIGVSVEDVHGLVLGGHGDDMVPLVRYTNVSGIPVESLLCQEELADIIHRTRIGGGEIVELLGNGSAYYAPSAALAKMTEAILKDKKRVLPAIVCLQGEYGYQDLTLGVPCVLGAKGVERIIEVELTVDEKDALDATAGRVEELIQVVKREALEK